MATSNLREERRRKIVDRSLDRMALITGRLQSLPSSPLASPSAFHQRSISEAPASTFISQEFRRQQSVPSYNIKAVPEAVNESSASVVLEHQTTHAIFKESKVETQPAKHETSKDATTQDNGTKAQPLDVMSVVEKLADSAKDVPQPCKRLPAKIFSSRRLNSCIIATEGTRSFCALMIALFVVLSYIDYPLLGWNIVRSESVVASRPLYILLLTDVIFVVARMFLEAHGADTEEAPEEIAKEGGDNWAGAEKLLERGLVAYQAIRGVFIDCSVYAVVVICGLSFV